MAKKRKKNYFHELHWRFSKGQWQFRVVAGNYEPIHSSERYTKKSTMDEEIKNFKEQIIYNIPVVRRNANWSQPKK